MSLTPEERRKIYEEEKARIEGSQPPQDSRTLKDLKPGTAGLLCYLGGWISGIIFLVLEQKDRFVRFHALQSIIVFGFLSIIYGILHNIPFVGPFFGVIIFVLGIVLWVLLIVKASQQQYFMVPAAGELAWHLLGSPATATPSPAAGSNPAEPKPAQSVPAGNSEATATPIVSRPPANLAPSKGRAGRIISSSFAIAWSGAVLLFFLFFNSYIAFYHQQGTIWFREPILTSAFYTWLPIVSTALILTILGHVLLLAVDNFVLRESTLTILDVFSVISFGALFVIFPFDFSPFGTDLVAPIELGVRLTLGLVVFGLCVGALARMIRLIVNLARGKASY